MTDDVKNANAAKGRLKEAAGDISGDADLKRQGTVDQTTGKVKEGVERAATRSRTPSSATSGKSPPGADGAGPPRRGRPRRGRGGPGR
jgi:uncharacterized protein YjbJ (UPF0337 family)